jgi:cell division septation protein DedD
MPAVPSVLDAPGVAPPTEDVPAEAAPAKRSVAETAPARDAFAVQLLAARSEADVGASWERLRGSYPDLLASLTPSVTRTSRAEGTFFRLRAGPLRNRASADALCRALSQREQSCFVVSPGS